LPETRAAIYVRISDDRETLRLGVERQLKDCRRICDEEGWTQVGPYEDNSKTAADPTKDRPDYDRMMRDIRAGKIDVVVVAVSDRLHRQPAELEQFIADAKAAGMTRLRTDRSREYDLRDYDAIRDMRKEVIDAAYEVDRLSYRIKRAMLDIAERGGWNGGMRPFGYQAVDKQLVVDEFEAPLIREAAQRILQGAPSTVSPRVGGTQTCQLCVAPTGIPTLFARSFRLHVSPVCVRTAKLLMASPPLWARLNGNRSWIVRFGTR